MLKFLSVISSAALLATSTGVSGEKENKKLSWKDKRETPREGIPLPGPKVFRLLFATYNSTPTILAISTFLCSTCPSVIRAVDGVQNAATERVEVV